MTGPDLIRLAHELVEHGGVHRLTNLVTAALHVLLEHERRPRSVEDWEDGPVGVGMSDKAMRNPAPLMTTNGERLPLPQSDCQGEYPSGITHAPDSPLLRPQDDFGRRCVPRYMPPVGPTIAAEGTD